MSLVLYLVYLSCAYLRPFETLWKDVQDLRPMIVLSGLAAIAAIAKALRRGSAGVRPVYFTLLGVLLACIALSKITNGWAGGATVAIGEFSTSAILFSITALTVASLDDVRKTLAVLLAVTFILCLFGIAAYHTGFLADQLVLAQGVSDSENIDESSEPVAIPALDHSGRYLWRVRSFGFLNDPNDFAQVIVVAVPLLGLLYRKGRGGRNLIAVGVPAAVFLYTIYLTHSRGAIIGLGSLLFFGLRKRLGMTRTLVLAGLLVAAMIGTNAAGGRGFSTDEESAGGRILAWSDGLSMLRSRPLFGVGYGSFTDYHELTAHNSFVLCFSELGLIGYFAWLSLVVIAFRDVNQVAEAPEETLDAGVVTCARLLRTALTGFLTCAWFLSRTYAPPLFVLLALCGAVWSLAATRKADGIAPPRFLLPTLGAQFATIAVVYAIVIMKHAG